MKKILKNTEREYYDQLFASNKTNLKQSWIIIKDIICKKKIQVLARNFISVINV